MANESMYADTIRDWVVRGTEPMLEYGRGPYFRTLPAEVRAEIVAAQNAGLITCAQGPVRPAIYDGSHRRILRFVAYRLERRPPGPGLAHVARRGRADLE